MTENELENLDAAASGSNETIAEELAAQLEDVLLIDIGGQELLVPVSETREVIRPLQLTPVPMGPDHMLGLANVRGQIVCIIDPSKISNLKPINPDITPQTRFVVLRHPRMHVGMWVDGVRAIFQVRSDDIPVAENETDKPNDYSRGHMSISGNTYEVFDSAMIFH